MKIIERVVSIVVLLLVGMVGIVVLAQPDSLPPIAQTKFPGGIVTATFAPAMPPLPPDLQTAYPDGVLLTPTPGAPVQVMTYIPIIDVPALAVPVFVIEPLQQLLQIVCYVITAAFDG